jgi:23S rRNA (adenine2030-N6)-methyltransferase
MNYRHHFHAGNFADVFKHALLVQLVRGQQRKEKGFLYLDTHAGRGRYDLAAAAQGDTLARRPEWPEGVGRLWTRTDLTPALEEYVAQVRAFDAADGATAPRDYPGSPRLVCALARPQDRLALCEQHPDEFLALAAEFRAEPRVAVHERDGYGALRALLPPPERRALVLIDPPFEAQDEFARIVAALAEGLRRLPAGVFAVWYPLTERARVDAFFAELSRLALPPTLALELTVAGESSSLKMKGCGLAVLNPPWQFEQTAAPLLAQLADVLAHEPGAAASARWLVPE